VGWAVKLGVVCIDALGWKVVRARWERYLPSAFESVEMFHPEKFGNPALKRGLRTLAKQLAVRRATETALKSGCDAVLVATNGEAAMLPLTHASRVAVYGDASHRQLNDLYRFGRPERKQRARERALSRLAAAGAKFIGMSTWCAEGFSRDYQTQAWTLPPAMDLEAFAFRPNGRERSVLFVGGQFQRKGGSTLLELAARPEWRETPFHLVTGHQKPASPNVHWHPGLTPESDELRQLFASSGAFALPTHADCTPQAILEAQASGIPVVSTLVGGISDLVQHSRTGWVVTPGSVAELGAALRMALESPGEIPAQARARVEKENDPVAHAAELRRILTADLT